MKKSGATILVLGLLALSIVASARTSVVWTSTSNEIQFTYEGLKGGISIEATSANYEYSFVMLSNGPFSGSFSGNGLSFVNSATFSGGGATISMISASDINASTASSGLQGTITESLNSAGNPFSLTVRVTVFGEQARLDIVKPKPTAQIKGGYLRDVAGNIIGGYFENIGNETFTGTIRYSTGLSYNIGWVAESVTTYDKGESPLVISIKPQQKIVFYFIPNPAGGITYFFPDLLWRGNPLSFSVYLPPPDSRAVAQFREMIYKWWTGYKDPEPNVDYVNVKIRLSSGDIEETIGFYLPINPYFPPPR